MSYSSPQYYPAVGGVRQAEPKARSAAAISRHLQRTHAGYTLAHGGHQIRIGPVAFWIVVGALVIMAVWSIATGTYFAFRDNVLTRLIGRQTELQFAYEDRIAELRAQVDRIMSRQLLDQNSSTKNSMRCFNGRQRLNNGPRHPPVIRRPQAPSNLRARHLRRPFRRRNLCGFAPSATP